MLDVPQASDVALAYMGRLPGLAGAVPAPLLGLFVSNSLAGALEAHLAGRDTATLGKMLEEVGLALEAGLPGDALAGVAHAVEELQEAIPPGEEGLEAEWLAAAALLPRASLDRLSAACGLARATRLRGQLASRPAATECHRLQWLNDVIEASCRATAPPSALLPAVRAAAGQAQAGPAQPITAWLLELMGRTSVLLRTAAPHVAAGLPLLLDVFSLAAAVLSGSDALLPPCRLECSGPARRAALPLATARLVGRHPSLAAALASWLTGLLKEPAVPEEWRSALRAALPALRYSEAWAEASVWGRLVLAA
jgi:hypothetical protein